MIGKEPAKGEGLAPSNLLSSTIGGELVISNNGQSRMFSVSIKDRGAVLPGGHTGKAFWYSKSDGSFTSSTYYYEEHPDWVTQWNAKKLADKYKDTIRNALEARLGVPKDVIRLYEHPYVYLNEEEIQKTANVRDNSRGSGMMSQNAARNRTHGGEEATPERPSPAATASDPPRGAGR